MNTWEKNSINTSRGTFEVFVKGEGMSICVTHLYSSFNESGDYFADSFTHNHKVYLVNLRESGGSEKAHEPYQLSMLEALFDLEEIRETIGIAKWTFAGHSTGGMLGIMYGIYFSDSLDSLLVIGAAARDYTFSTNCIYNPDHPQFTRMQELIEILKQSGLSDQKRKDISIERTKLSLHQSARYEQLFDKNIHKKMSAARMNFFNRELPIFDVTQKLKLITVPTLIICGKHDVQCPLQYSMEMKENIFESDLVIFRESNHYPFLEEKQLFQAEIDKFLKGL
ncbi:proline iminopeptidase [Virgibacillus phasianinus]|uniref:Proline iminopeptidase n=1 Tax=Virgibacillus phasianinus TaxID=2017483 RepID=A0A220TZ82_9BACI|nr:alpha/beta hydrolase [Virgibacillus phasianinus]ASK61137.1 proline iminopeptidase [Virgibacillus phasianinus]